MTVRRVFTYVAAILLVIWTLFPIYWLLNMSLMFKPELLSVPTHLWPHEPTFSNYTRLFGASGPRKSVNTLARTARLPPAARNIFRPMAMSSGAE